MNWIKKALTRAVSVKGPRGKKLTVQIEPSEKLVLGVKFAITMTICLTLLEIAHMAFLGVWNSEIFAAITGFMGTVTGILIGQKG